jgi:hypothetical protein
LCVSVCLVYSLFYGRKHRPCEALNAAADLGKPFSQPGAASACCSGMVTIVTVTTPSNASAATIAIMAIDTFLSCSPDEWFIFVIN